MKRVIPLLLALICNCSFAEDHDGTVNITGTIQDNTCELSPESQKNNIKMGTYSIKHFIHPGDISPPKTFTLNLQNCGPAATEATVTFSGIVDRLNPELFAIEDGGESANGLALGIYDSNGKIIPPGETSVGVNLKPNQTSVTMIFYARYVSVLAKVSAGDANVLVTFVINYG